MRYLFLLLFTSLFLNAQTYEEYLRSQNEAFSSYKDAYDKEFSGFLNKEWKAYKASQGVESYEEEKPKTLPKVEKRAKVVIKKRILVQKKVEEPKKQKVFKKIIIQETTTSLKTMYMDYFGVSLALHYDRVDLLNGHSPLDEKSITQAWTSLAQSNYTQSIDELNHISKKLKLNDWAKYLLVKELASRVYKYDKQRNVFTWFVLLKMGYDTRIAYQNNKIILLLPVKGDLYSTVYYQLDNKKYYALDYYAKGKLGSIKTYAHSYKGELKAIDFSLKTLPRFSPEVIDKNFRFRPFKKVEIIALQYDKHLLNFFQTYPQVSYKNYFSTVDADVLKVSVQKSFNPLLMNKSESEALDVLLSFVQTSFKYKVDFEQFGKEKVMFSSETLFYPYSDCEDRAILFSYLVKTLLGMDVVGLQYKNHMATAVKIKEKVKGEYVKVKNSKYIIADPTYINANVGLSMPAYKGKKPYIIY